MQEVGVVAGAAVIANLFESYLGAAIQGKALWMTNDIVNGIQICLAACISLVTMVYIYLRSCMCCAMTIIVHPACAHMHRELYAEQASCTFNSRTKDLCEGHSVFGVDSTTGRVIIVAAYFFLD